MSLRLNVIANYLGQGWTSIMGLVFVPLYIHHLGMEAYGLIGLFAVVQAWLALLDMGLSPTLTREMARFTANIHTTQYIRNLLRSVEYITFLVAALVGLVVFSCSSFLAVHWLKSGNLPIPVVANALSVMALVVALRFCEGIYRGCLIGLQRQVWLNSATAALATLRHGGAIAILLFVSPTLSAFFLWQAVISLLTLLLFAAYTYRAIPLSPVPAQFSMEAVKHIRQFASGMLGISMLSILLTQVDKLLLSRMVTLDRFAAYSLASTISMVLFTAILPVTQAVYPVLVELVSCQNMNGLVDRYHFGAQFIAVITAPPAIILFFFGDKAIYVWSGNPTLAQSIAPILAPLVLGTFLNGLMCMPYQLQLAYGWTALTIRVNLLAVCLMVPALLWLVPKYGPSAAAWVWVALNVMYVLVTIQFLHRRLLPTEKLAWYFQDLLLPAMGAGGAILLAKIIVPFAFWTSRAGWLAFLVLVGAVAMATTAFAAGRVRRFILAWIGSRFALTGLS